MKSFILLINIIFYIFIISGCDSPLSDTGTTLFDRLTSSAEYTEYITFQNILNNPSTIFGRIITYKNNQQYPVAGAIIKLSSTLSTVSNEEGYYYLKNIFISDNTSEVIQKSFTFVVEALGYKTYSDTITLNKGSVLEINVNLLSIYNNDNPGGRIYGIVKDKYTQKLLNSLEVTILGYSTVITGKTNGNGTFFYENVGIGTQSVIIIDPNNKYPDYYQTFEVNAGENHICFELDPYNNNTSFTSKVYGIVKSSNGYLLQSIEVILDYKYKAITDYNGWFELKDSNNNNEISIGKHILTAKMHTTYDSSKEVEVIDYAKEINILYDNNFVIIEMNTKTSGF